MEDLYVPVFTTHPPRTGWTGGDPGTRFVFENVKRVHIHAALLPQDTQSEDIDGCYPGGVDDTGYWAQPQKFMLRLVDEETRFVSLECVTLARAERRAYVGDIRFARLKNLLRARKKGTSGRRVSFESCRI